MNGERYFEYGPDGILTSRTSEELLEEVKNNKIRVINPNDKDRLSSFIKILEGEVEDSTAPSKNGDEYNF